MTFKSFSKATRTVRVCSSSEKRVSLLIARTISSNHSKETDRDRVIRNTISPGTR